jgi:hypothetical protein
MGLENYHKKVKSPMDLGSVKVCTISLHKF